MLTRSLRALDFPVAFLNTALLSPCFSLASPNVRVADGGGGAPAEKTVTVTSIHLNPLQEPNSWVCNRG